ncbi:MAG: MBOAT family protein, partial [Candidatus Omnitrophica bacterium]|nr:MBOAT family protein [Candidatus Omnitrophota bacterium]
GYFALYTCFFPLLLAGPIERSYNLLPQLQERHDFDDKRLTKGLMLMAWGFFKKLVIADRLAVVVTQVYGHLPKYTGVALITATVFLAFQVYCDFSGYSDIALGTGEVLGFRFIRNFNCPYFSRSITEVWRRWHISLSSWVHDYLFTPVSIALRGLGLAGICIAI